MPLADIFSVNDVADAGREEDSGVQGTDLEKEGRPFKLGFFFELVSSGIGLQQSSPIFPFVSLPGNDFGTCWRPPIRFSCISQNLMNC